MIDYGKCQSTVKPEPFVIDEKSVWVHTDITEISEGNEDMTFNGWEYNKMQYDKDEYILSLSSQITDTQVALCELYEGMVNP